jgi:hypothetical protein
VVYSAEGGVGAISELLRVVVVSGNTYGMGGWGNLTKNDFVYQHDNIHDAFACSRCLHIYCTMSIMMM